ncbi:MAG: DNA repair protein RadC [Bacteroidales bacterium]|nr:DNA repair protein RadC [Bacteroidales bacterium]
MKMKDWVPEERPREKMRLRGAKALSNAELLAILLGSGTGGKNVLEVAQEIMVSADGRLTLLGSMPLERLVTQKGVGEVRAYTIAAALELGRRSFEELALIDKQPLTSPELVYRLMRPILKPLDHEECWVLYLNRVNRLLGKEKLTSGSLEATLIDIKRILKRAIEKQCSNVILVHNHPSGSPIPGDADIVQTEALRSALASVEISLLDHIIVAEDSYYSFEQERVLHI